MEGGDLYAEKKEFMDGKVQWVLFVYDCGFCNTDIE